MLDKQVNALRCIIEDSEIRNYAGEAFWNLIQAVITADAFAGITAAGDIKKIIFHMPTLIFWDKMKRYLLGTFRSYEDQIKMSSKFNKDHSKYNAFVKKQIQLVNELDDDQKVDFFATLTRCFLLSEFESDLYFKLAKIISDLTCSELLFLKGISYDYISENTTMISLLYQNGLFIQYETDEGEIRYILSDLAKALKQNSLNFDEGILGQNRFKSYGQLAPLNHPTPPVWSTISNLGSSSDLRNPSMRNTSEEI